MVYLPTFTLENKATINIPCIKRLFVWHHPGFFVVGCFFSDDPIGTELEIISNLFWKVRDRIQDLRDAVQAAKVAGPLGDG